MRNSSNRVEFERMIIKDYLDGNSMSKVAEIHGFSSHVAVLNILKKNSITRRSISETLIDTSRARKHNINESFFNEIDSEDKAYILGWFLTDGWVYNKTCEYKVAIGCIDLEIITLIKERLKSSSKIYLRKIKSKNHHQMYELDLSSKLLYNALAKYGCVPNKTFSVEYPRQISGEFTNHFIRGLVDGDGSVLKDKNGRLSISLTGTKKLLTEVRKRLLNVCGKNPTLNTHGRVFRITYYGKIALKIRDFLYLNAKYFLERKRKTAYELSIKRSIPK